MSVIDACDVVEVGMLEEGISVAGLLLGLAAKGSRNRRTWNTSQRLMT